MSDKIFALLAVSVSGLFSLLVSLTAHWLTASRESRTLRREVRRDDVQATRALYEEAIYMLERSCHTLGVGTDEDRDKMIRFLARLSLHATPQVRDLYFRTAEKLDEWTQQARTSNPEVHSGFLVFRPSVQGGARQKAQEAWPDFERNLDQLKTMMKNHLEQISSSV